MRQIFRGKSVSKIIDGLRLENVAWNGQLDDVEFLSRLFDLQQIPSTDSRCKDASGEICQHRYNNNDWELVPDSITDATKGAENIRMVLRYPGQLTKNVAKLRALYGTGHGRDGQHRGLEPRHAD